jgi:predicted transcriptional regulator
MVARVEPNGSQADYDPRYISYYVYVYDVCYAAAMTALSLRMPGELERRLEMEARRAGVPRSEIARTAIEELLDRRERERYLSDFVAEARATYGDSRIREESTALADEALPLDNEALEIAETSQARRPTRAREKRKAGA